MTGGRCCALRTAVFYTNTNNLKSNLVEVSTINSLGKMEGFIEFRETVVNCANNGKQARLQIRLLA